MLTQGDDFSLHQTPEPTAYSGTDRNFHDRYFGVPYVGIISLDDFREFLCP